MEYQRLKIIQGMNMMPEKVVYDEQITFSGYSSQSLEFYRSGLMKKVDVYIS